MSRQLLEAVWRAGRSEEGAKHAVATAALTVAYNDGKRAPCQLYRTWLPVKGFSCRVFGVIVGLPRGDRVCAYNRRGTVPGSEQCEKSVYGSSFLVCSPTALFFLVAQLYKTVKQQHNALVSRA